MKVIHSVVICEKPPSKRPYIRSKLNYLPSDAKQDPEERIFLSAPNSHGRFFFLHTFWSPAFDFTVGCPDNESRSYTLSSVILKVDVVMTSTTNVLTTQLRDLLMVCKTRFVSTCENRGKPFLVCKKYVSKPWCFENLQSQIQVCLYVTSEILCI